MNPRGASNTQSLRSDSDPLIFLFPSMNTNINFFFSVNTNITPLFIRPGLRPGNCEGKKQENYFHIRGFDPVIDLKSNSLINKYS